MESSIWVAVMTSLPAKLHLWIISFWSCGRRFASISTPRSPRATMIPSAAAMMASRLSRPSCDSIFAMIFMLEPASSISARICSIVSALRTKEAATKSKPSSIPNLMSSISFSVRPGRRMLTFGTLTPFFSPSSPPFVMRQWMSAPSTRSTWRPMRPSSIRMVLPSWTSSLSPL